MTGPAPSLGSDAAVIAHKPARRNTQKDPLTGLYEQDYLSRALERLLHKSKDQKITATLGLLQLENFYEIRSWVGKPEANILLSDIAGILVKTLPEKVLLCRYPHYEFGILLLNECSINSRLITDRVKQALLSAVSSSIPAQLGLRCSIGLTALDSSVPSADVLFARARHNLSHSHYQRGTESQLELDPRAAVKLISQALAENKLCLCFQATPSLLEDGLQHYEIRCRLPTADNSAATRALFQAAANNALGEEIDRRVVAQALKLLKMRNSGDLRLVVNLTHNSLVSPRFIGWLEAELAACKPCAQQLAFQVSEIDVLIAQHHLGYFCHELEQLGIRLGISHFGCTADPFRYLSLLKVHFVKLDNSLHAKINVNARQYQLLIQMVERLHEKGLKVIVAMIEKMAMLPLLWQARVNFVQGNALQEPSTSMIFEFLKEETLGDSDRFK